MPELEHKVWALHDAKASDAGSGSFSGYASVFGVTDLGGDIVLPGAYAETIPQFVERGFIPWSHDWTHQLPVATIADAHEDAHGLHITAEYHSTVEAQAARTVVAERLRRGKFMGLSIGYLAEEAAPSPEGRLLKKVHLFETSLTTVPMLPQAGVLAAKGVPAEDKAAIRSHSTGTTTAGWDSGAAWRNLPNTPAALKAACAWTDPDADPATKDAYKFIHHMVSAGGDVGAANLTACSTGIGVLNGGRGGTTIPAADHAGVHAHLAKHLEDAGRAAPPLKAIEPEDMEAKVGRRNSASDATRIQSMHDAAVELGAACAAEPKGLEGADPAALLGALEAFGAAADLAQLPQLPNLLTRARAVCRSLADAERRAASPHDPALLAARFRDFEALYPVPALAPRGPFGPHGGGR